MIEDLLLLPFEGGFDWLVERDEDRTTAQQLSLFVGVAVVVLAIALGVTSGPLYGLAAGIVALALLIYGA